MQNAIYVHLHTYVYIYVRIYIYEKHACTSALGSEPRVLEFQVLPLSSADFPHVQRFHIQIVALHRSRSGHLLLLWCVCVPLLLLTTGSFLVSDMFSTSQAAAMSPLAFCTASTARLAAFSVAASQHGECAHDLHVGLQRRRLGFCVALHLLLVGGQARGAHLRQVQLLRHRDRHWRLRGSHVSPT